MSIKSIIIFIAALESAIAFAVSSSPFHFGIQANISLRSTRGGWEEPSLTTLFSKTRLQYRNHDEDEFLYMSNGVIESETFKQNIPQAIFLPRPALDKKRAEQMMNTEMILGRIAMASSIVMISAELVVGTSLPQQIVNVLH